MRPGRSCRCVALSNTQAHRQAMVDSGAMAAAQVNSTTPSLHRNYDPHYADLRPQLPYPTLTFTPTFTPHPSPLTHHTPSPLTTLSLVVP